MKFYDGRRNAMKYKCTLTPKEGVGRSNRLGDARLSKGLRFKRNPFFLPEDLK